MTPDLTIYVKSSHEQLFSLQRNIQQLLDLGMQVGVIVDPDNRIVTVCRANSIVTALTNGDIFTVPELLPGWKLLVSRIWATDMAR